MEKILSKVSNEQLLDKTPEFFKSGDEVFGKISAISKGNIIKCSLCGGGVVEVDILRQQSWGIVETQLQQIPLGTGVCIEITEVSAQKITGKIKYFIWNCCVRAFGPRWIVCSKAPTSTLTFIVPLTWFRGEDLDIGNSFKLMSHFVDGKEEFFQKDF